MKFGTIPSVLALSFISAPGWAETRDPAAAQALFDAGRALMNQGRVADACPKLAESQRLDPGIGTQFHLASCYEQSGRIASAWALFLEVVSQARASGQHDREEAASAHATRLGPRLPKLKVRVPEANRIANLEVRRDGVLIGPVQWDSELPVDPGKHELTVRASGKRPFAATIQAREKEIVNFEVPALVDDPDQRISPLPGTSEPQPSIQHSEQVPLSTASPMRETSSGGSSVLPLVLLSAGVIGIGVGTTFGLLARSKYEDSKAECQPDNPNLCGSRGVELRNSAIRNGNVATVAFIAGGAALTGAGAVWLLSGSSTKESEGRLTLEGGVARSEAAMFVKGTF